MARGRKTGWLVVEIKRVRLSLVVGSKDIFVTISVKVGGSDSHARLSHAVKKVEGGS